MSASAEGAGRRKLPIGIQTFRDIREEGFYYVDKTAFIHRMVEGPALASTTFFQRPRRFGKSLLLDTIKELFAGSEELFRGLAIHDRWRWVRQPIVRISFGSGNFAEPGYLLEDLGATAGRHRGSGQRASRCRECLHPL